ncbi:MAG: carbamoyl-phosphate synthase small subunit [Saprospiraceae bacterium]|jgi:carbamoyl-phosphate synthase small subunit
MSSSNMSTAVLLLEDGTIYEGISYGIPGLSTGELCFNTGMTGYQEVFTDPSYFGQMMVTTNAHIGNYGVKDDEAESERIQISGLVCKNFTFRHSREMASQDIRSYFESQKVMVIAELDTRAIVRHIRDKGAMNALISCDSGKSIDELKLHLKGQPSMQGLELASKVTTVEPYELGNKDAPFKVAVLDYGTKKNILRCFEERGCRVKVFPAKSSYEEIDAWDPDGYFISNGPGDPSSMDYAVNFVKRALEDKKPLFGICLGHQLLALALGIPTYKMHNGHRGINHPVKNMVTGKCEITSQNHGFGVSPDAIEKNLETVEVTHINLNDGTVEGIRHRKLPAFSVQYHPESSPGPHDSRYLFDEFVEMLKSQKS